MGSAVQGLRSAEPAERSRSFGVLVRAYWRPVYKHLRLKWHASEEDAEDLTQGFFATALEKDFFRSYDPARARFRTYLKTCLDGYAAKARRAARRKKRGGDVVLPALDFEEAEREIARGGDVSPGRPDEMFDREWARGILGEAVAALRAECDAAGKRSHFELLERYDLDEGAASYEELAASFGLAVHEVRNRLAFARRKLKGLVLERLGEITMTEREKKVETRFVLGTGRSKAPGTRVPTQVVSPTGIPITRAGDAPLVVGEILADRFEIEALASVGGMGAVYRGRDRLGGGAVAVKLLREGEVDADRFLREGAALSELAHPAIVRWIAHGMSPSGRPWLAMEWLEGETLTDLLRRSPRGLDIGRVASLGARIAQALAATHARGLVHRDVKPSNVFLPEGSVLRAKLVDFGIARRRHTPRGTRAGAAIGTPGYMAPEQARGDAEVDGRVDLFALGCLLYECLTGGPLFVAADLFALQAKILVEESPRVRVVRPNVPPALDDLVARLLEKDPARRPQDAEAVATALGEIARTAGTPKPARATPAPDAPAVGPEERRVVSAVLASGSGLARPREVHEAVDRHGAEVASLPDGTLVAVLAGVGTATDRATLAARLALELRRLCPGVPIALVSGVTAAGALPGDLVERGIALIRAAPTRRAPTAGDGAIRVDDTTRGLMGPRFEVRDDELCAELPFAESARTLLGRPGPFVGREAELGALEATFDSTQDERVARAVLVTGPAGVGKSRLREETIARLRERTAGLEVLFARGDPVGAGSPFGLVGSALRRAAGILEGEPIETKRRKLRGRIGRHLSGPVAERASEFLGELAGAPSSGEGSEPLRAARRDAMLMGDSIRGAFQDWLSVECAAGPVVLVLEDLHWGDLPSVQLVDAALRALAEKPFFVLALGRPEVATLFPNLWAERSLSEIRLPPLGRRASERLVAQALGDDAGHAQVARIADRAEGNPFYLEELVRAVASGAGDELPETVLAMVQSRLAVLPEGARRILRAASVFGATFHRGGLLALLGGEPPSVIDDWLDVLVRQEVIVRRGESALPSEPAYAFRHALVREAAHEMLTEGDRSRGHSLAGDWLEEVGEVDALVLAEHFDRGGQPERAARFHLRAAQQALEGHDFAKAALSAQRAGVLPDVRGDALIVEAEARCWLADYALAQRAGEKAMEILSPGSAAWLGAVRWVAGAATAQGHMEEVEALGTSLRTAPSSPATAAARADTALTLVHHLLRQGRHGSGGEIFEAFEAEADALAGSEPAVAARLHRVRARLALLSGDSAAYAVERERAAIGWERAGHLRQACEDRLNLGFGLCTLGLHPEAEAELRAGKDLATRMGLAVLRALALHNLGLAVARQGRLDEAADLQRQAIDASGRLSHARLEGGARVYLAEILAAKGDLDGALREATAAADLLASVPPLLALALATRSRIELGRGRPTDALAAVRDALLRLGDDGAEEGEALVRLALAEALDATGDRPAAGRAIAEARDRLLARAERITRADWRSSFLDRVPENARTLELARAWLG